MPGLTDKAEILRRSNFGERIAEDETDSLASYFVETNEWAKVIAGSVDIVYGPKGAGKSAIYALIRKREDDLKAHRITAIGAENVRGTPVFEDLVVDPPASEEQFRFLWKLYFLSICGHVLKDHELKGENVQFVTDSLEKAGLLVPGQSLSRMLRAALDYVRRVELSVGMKVSASGQPEGFEAKISFREPGEEQRAAGHVSVDELLTAVDGVFSERDVRFWIVLDRLDVAFAESPELEMNALRALFRVYRDMAGLQSLRLKIFLRDDIWKRITAGGFREGSHVTKSITLAWDAKSLLHLIVSRALHNEAVRDYYGVDQRAVLASSEEQKKLFYRMFPNQVDAGKRKSTTLDWMLTRTMDGTRKTAPRELIHLLNTARDEQIKSIELGTAPPQGETLIDRNALKSALPAVSKIRYEQTFLAEHATLKPFVSKLDSEKTQQSLKSLVRIWGLSTEDALSRAEQLVEAGFFERQGTKDDPVFWVPFLYREALNMVQGPAN